MVIAVTGIYMKAPTTVETAAVDRLVVLLLHLSRFKTYVTVVVEIFTVIPTEKSEESNMTLLECILAPYLLQLIILVSTVPRVVPTGMTLTT